MLKIQKAPYQNGTIYLVGVPIGNIDDISYRAVKILQKVDVIFAEDTRRANRLLDDLQIKDKRIYAHYEHNQEKSVKGIIQLALDGYNIAFISDAGMPGVSDPGYLLAKKAIENDINIVPISGPCAAILSLVSSGLPSSSFLFIGFLPRTESQIIKKLEDYKYLKDSLIFYESPRRVISMLKSLKLALGNRNICIGRELTKIHEEFLRGTISEVLEELESREKVLGEFCIIVEGFSGELDVDKKSLEEDIKEMINLGISAKDIKNELSIKYKIHKKEVYNLYLSKIKNND